MAHFVDSFVIGLGGTRLPLLVGCKAATVLEDWLSILPSVDTQE